MTLPKKIQIKYFDPDMPRLEKIAKGDWIDLRSAIDIGLKAGEFKLIPLGIAMKLPKGYEAQIAPRGSSFKNFGVTQTNSIGVVDNAYCGDNDQWFWPVVAHRDTKIDKYDRVCQFRIVEKMPDICFEEVEKLTDKDRGSHGSTGIK